ncbi:related to IspD/IspF bifunctional enzyme (Rhodobacter capsulatus) [Desulfotalea psychrophila LSv54]|nr:related to IspD/IspF bifunctional enzyme (Rhodobacter capsulatus) [Desulfotalea psychrophila LSv54]
MQEASGNRRPSEMIMAPFGERQNSAYSPLRTFFFVSKQGNISPQDRKMKNGAVIIPAAGSGTRMKLDYPKQYHAVAGTPIIVHTIRAFNKHPCIAKIILVVPQDHLEESKALLQKYQLENISIVTGGARRQDSVLRGLQEVPESIDIVLVHDGARPMVSAELISRCYKGAQQYGAVIAAVPVKDTLKRGAGRIVTGTVDREGLWQAQTPQAARKALLVKAFKENGMRNVTDESTLLEGVGIPVTLIEGSETNIKITRPEDLILAENFLREKKEPMQKIRIGHGFDAHQLVEKRRLILGGVEIPYHLGLAGHSDADVLVHALCDALLGAIGAGDIGRHFPDSSDAFKDIYSIRLLESVMQKVGELNYKIGNADISVICQAPKLAPYLKQMQEIIATSCACQISDINIKATTTEKMGYTGRGEGISCHAVVLLQQ